jgi:hypothetical protein
MELIICTVMILALLMVMPVNDEVCDMTDEEIDTFEGPDMSEM